MRKYELTIVLDEKVTLAKRKNITATIEKIIGTFKGKVGAIEDWGIKPGGYFIHFPLELESSSAKGFSAKLKVENDIIKYLFVRKDN